MSRTPDDELCAFGDYALVWLRSSDGQRQSFFERVHDWQTPGEPPNAWRYGYKTKVAHHLAWRREDAALKGDTRTGWCESVSLPPPRPGEQLELLR